MNREMFICPMALLIFGEPSIISQSSERVARQSLTGCLEA